MSRSITITLVSIAATLLAACSGASDAESTLTDDDALTSARDASTTTYEGTFEVKGATFSITTEIVQPLRVSSYQKQISSKFYLDSLGLCSAYAESQRARVRITITDAAGNVIADDATRSHTNVSRDLERQTACPDGFILEPAVLRTLDTELVRPGLALELAGEEVHVPGGYGQPGLFFVRGAAELTPESPLVYSQFSDSAYNRSEVRIDRGTLELVMPREITINVGVGPTFPMAELPVTLRAR